MNFKKLFGGIALALVSVFGLASCGDSTTTNTSKEAPTFDKDAGYDAITRTHKLTKNYEGKSFIDDGIGEVTLASTGDGDTAVFRLEVPGKNGVVLPRIRFAGVDTPECTAEVEKWGKFASKFTGAALENAVEIVLEATSVPAEKDSGGSRYMGYVWYKETADDDFKMLNLELVENGYSPANEHSVSLERVFQEAEAFAKEKELHIWSADVDPFYSKEVRKVTIKHLIEDINNPYQQSEYYDHDEEVGANVRFEAFVLSHEITDSGTNYYTVGQYDEDGKLYTFKLYGGYSSDAINSNLLVGHLYHIKGNVQKYHDAWQLAVGKTYIAKKEGDQYTYRLQRDYYCQFDSNHERFEMSRETGVKSYLTVTNVTLEGTTLTIEGTALDHSTATETKTYVLKVNVESNPNFTVQVGDRLYASGILAETGSNIYNVSIGNILVK